MGVGCRVEGFGLRFRFSGFGYLVSGFVFRVSGVRFRVPGSGFRVSDVVFQVSDFGILVSSFGFRVPGFGIRVSSFGSRVLGFGYGRLAGVSPIGGASNAPFGRENPPPFRHHLLSRERKVCYLLFKHDSFHYCLLRIEPERFGVCVEGLRSSYRRMRRQQL